MATRRRWAAVQSSRAGCLVAALVSPLLATPALAAPEVVVTLKPVHGLVAAIMEGSGTPHLLLDGNASPHAYAMKPSDVRRLNGADIVIRVSERLEVFLSKPLSVLRKRTRVVTLDRVPGLQLYGLRAGGDFEPHSHGGGSKTAGHGHDHGPRTGAAATDGHLWLDPRNARVVALHLAEVLAEAAPVEADRYRRNGKALAERLEALDAELAGSLKPLAGRPFLVFHDAYQYLERRYGLAGAGAVTVNPEVPPSAQRLSQLRQRLAKTGIVCVFAEPQFPPRAIDTIIEGTRVRRGTLDPLGAALPAGPGQYFALMEALARDLKGCLEAE